MRNEELKNNFKKYVKKKPSIEANKYIYSFRKRPETVGFVKKNWDKKKKFYKNNIANLINIAANNLLQIFSKKLVKVPFWTRLKNFIITATNRSNYSMYRDYSDKELKTLNYIFFPLHKEPELAQNFLDPNIYNQYEIVKLLSIYTPFNYKLFVKEHRLNHGRRPKDFLNRITNLHNVELINPYDGQFKYLKNAKLVIADNGTSGWEAMILETPVLNISESFYDTIVKNRSKDFSKIDIDIQRILKERIKPKDSEIARLYDAEKSSCYFENKQGIRKSLIKIIAKI